MISIIVPVYMVEKYLPKCIESILNQTYKKFELILIDDGSPDNCPQICDEYAKKDSRIVVVHQKNKGVSAARNAGLDLAKGKYIGFVDPDDFVAPEMYETMRGEMERRQVELAICGYDYFDENGNVDTNRLYKIRENELLTQKEVMNRFSDMPPSIRHGVVNKLFKKNLLREMRFIEGLHSSEDVFFLNEYVSKVKNAIMIHQPFYKNTVRKGSATHGGLSIESLADSFKAHEFMYKSCVLAYPELKNHCLAFLMDIYTLKYNEAKSKIKNIDPAERESADLCIKRMRKYIKKYAIHAVFDDEIYWKTRIMYILM